MGTRGATAETQGDRRYAGARVCALGTDRRGATIIEFALVAAPLVALIVAVIQTSLVFFSQQTLETAAEDTARLIVTNQAQQAGMSKSQFKQAACSQLPGFMDCDNLMIDVRTADDFADVDTTVPDLTYDSDGNVTNPWKFEMGGADQIVVMRLMYQLPVISAPLGFDMSNMQGGRRLLIATSVFQPEPTA
jgi:Flp pilus assembly protein TadG